LLEAHRRQNNSKGGIVDKFTQATEKLAFLRDCSKRTRELIEELYEVLVPEDTTRVSEAEVEHGEDEGPKELRPKKTEKSR